MRMELCWRSRGQWESLRCGYVGIMIIPYIVSIMGYMWSLSYGELVEDGRKEVLIMEFL